MLVSIDYRLGALGTFVNDVVAGNVLALRDLALALIIEPPHAGNFGLMDQVLAMEWVQSYISYFGGKHMS